MPLPGTHADRTGSSHSLLDSAAGIDGVLTKLVSRHTTSKANAINITDAAVETRFLETEVKRKTATCEQVRVIFSVTWIMVICDSIMHHGLLHWTPQWVSHAYTEYIHPYRSVSGDANFEFGKGVAWLLLLANLPSAFRHCCMRFIKRSVWDMNMGPVIMLAPIWHNRFIGNCTDAAVCPCFYEGFHPALVLVFHIFWETMALVMFWSWRFVLLQGTLTTISYYVNISHTRHRQTEFLVLGLISVTFACLAYQKEQQNRHECMLHICLEREQESLKQEQIAKLALQNTVERERIRHMELERKYDNAKRELERGNIEGATIEKELYLLRAWASTDDHIKPQITRRQQHFDKTPVTSLNFAIPIFLITSSLDHSELFMNTMSNRALSSTTGDDDGTEPDGRPALQGRPQNQWPSPGSHAFVKVYGEGFFRVHTQSTIFGKATGHPFLANEKPVLYAGEIDFGKDGDVIRWNNLSGTYKPRRDLAYQVGLPLDKFWYVLAPNELVRLTDDALAEGIESSSYLRISTNTAFRRTFRYLESQFHDTTSKVKHLHDEILCRNTAYATAFTELESMRDERMQAIVTVGYASRAATRIANEPSESGNSSPPISTDDA